MEVANQPVATGGRVLLSAWGARRRACRAYLADAADDADATLAVVVGDVEERFLDAWYEGADPTGDLAVLDVGGDVRSAAASPDAARRGVVRGLPVDDVEALPQEVAAYLDDWRANGRRAVVYVEAAAELESAVGLPGVVELLDRVAETVRAGDGEIYVGVAGDRSDVVAALSPAFDSVVDLSWTPAGAYRATPREGAERQPLAPDVAFDLLRSTRRRRALWYLARTGAAAVDDLIDYLDRTDAGFGAEAETEERRLAIALRQFDLPKLADAGVVAYDDETGSVEPTERLSALRPYLALAATHRTRTDEST